MRKVEKRLRERIKELETELEKVKNDRDKFRNDTISNLKTAIRIHGEGKYWAMDSMIETFAKQLSNKVIWFW